MLVLRKGYQAMELVRGRFYDHPFFREKFDGLSAPDPVIELRREATHLAKRIQTKLKEPK